MGTQSCKPPHPTLKLEAGAEAPRRCPSRQPHPAAPCVCLGGVCRAVGGRRFVITAALCLRAINLKTKLGCPGRNGSQNHYALVGEANKETRTRRPKQETWGWGGRWMLRRKQEKARAVSHPHVFLAACVRSWEPPGVLQSPGETLEGF